MTRRALPPVTMKLDVEAAAEVNASLRDPTLPLVDRVDLMGQLWVRQTLIELALEQPPDKLKAFDKVGDEIIAAAHDQGAFVSLARLDLDRERLDELICRAERRARYEPTPTPTTAYPRHEHQ